VSYSEHQQRVLRAMGVRVWQPVADPLPAAVTALAAPVPAPSPVPVPVPVVAPVVVARPQAVTTSTTLAGPVATMDMPTLREAVAHCRACTLCETRQQTVFGVGHPQAQWMVVGEAPGEQEDRQGEPFVGAAGQLLDAMLRALRLTRASDGPQAPSQRVYIANTLKCRPPHNRNPTAEEVARCEPFLQRQLQLVRPRIILAMGRFAIQALLRSTEPVGKLRGRVHSYQGVPLVVTYHPAYLLRNLPEKARAWDDLCLAADVFAQSSARP
jgi:uracil-DNA glycosylase